MGKHVILIGICVNNETSLFKRLVYSDIVFTVFKQDEEA